MDHLSKWQVYCSTEGTTVETWRAFTPAKCPNDPRHVLDLTQTQKLDDAPLMLNEDVVAQRVVMDAKAYSGTNGFYQCKGYSFDVPAGQVVSQHDIVMPFTSCQYGLTICGDQANEGDMFDIIIAPDTMIGVLLSGASNGDTKIYPNKTVIQHAVPGFHLTIGDQSNCVVTGVSAASNCVELLDPLSNAPAYSGVYVNAYIAKDIKICGTQEIALGYGSMGGKNLAKGTIVRTVYTNNSSNLDAKYFHMRSETTY